MQLRRSIGECDFYLPADEASQDRDPECGVDTSRRLPCGSVALTNGILYHQVANQTMPHHCMARTCS